MENLIGKTVYVRFRNTQGEIIDYDDEFVTVDYPSLGFSEKVNYKMESVMIDDNDTMEHGGSIENKEMLMNQSYEVTHHAKELSEVIKKTKRVEPWVVAKMERATTDLSDITHYLDGERKMEHGGEIAIRFKKPKNETFYYVDYTIHKEGTKRAFFETEAEALKFYDEIIVHPFSDMATIRKESYNSNGALTESKKLGNYTAPWGKYKRFEHGGSMYAEGGYIFQGNTFMNGEYKPVYKKDDKYYLKSYNPTRYRFFSDQDGIKNYQIFNMYADGGVILSLKDKKYDITYNVRKSPTRHDRWEVVSSSPNWKKDDVLEFVSEEDAIYDAKLSAGLIKENDPEAYFMRNEYAKGGNITSLSNIPNLMEEIEAGRVTYRGGSNGTRIRVQGKEYLISSDDFRKLDWDDENKSWKNKIKFSAPNRKYADGGNINDIETTGSIDSPDGIKYEFKVHQISPQFYHSLVGHIQKYDDSEYYADYENDLYDNDFQEKTFATFNQAEEWVLNKIEKEKAEYMRDYGMNSRKGSMYADGGMTNSGDVYYEYIFVNKNGEPVMNTRNLSVNTAMKEIAELKEDKDLEHNESPNGNHSFFNSKIGYTIMFRKSKMYAKGGNISSENQEKIAKLEKVLSSNLVPESAKEKARLEIERLKSETSIGISANQRDLNKKALALVEKNNIIDFVNLVSFTLEDANYHTANYEFAKLVDTSIKTKEDWYKSPIFKGDKKTREVGIEIANFCGWDMDAIKECLDFVLRMKGYHKIANALKEATKDEYPNRIETLSKNQELYVKEIASRTVTDQRAVTEFIKDNGLNDDETLNLLQGLGMGKIKPMEFVNALMGNKEFEKQIIDFAKSNEAFKTPESKPKTKVKLKDVEILWAEGDNKKYDKFPKKYTSWKSANEAVKPIAKDTEEYDGGYNKVKFVITFEDDEQYEGRLDVDKKTDNPNVEPYIGNVFGVHVKEWLDYLLSDKSGESEAQKQEVRDWMAKYDLGLDTQEEEVIESKEVETPAIVVKDDRLKGKHISDVSKYVPHWNIESITFTIDGKQHTVKGSDIFDGIYVENSVLGIKAKRTTKKQPKVSRTQFEDETFEFAKGGKIESVAVVRDRVESFLSPYGYSARVEDAGNGEIHIEPSTTKVGDKRKDFFDGMQIHRFADGMYEVSEYQAGPNQDELYIYKETKSLPLALKDLIKGNNRKPIKKW
jgi:hypothetical protein